jgi:hypothetical protein
MTTTLGQLVPEASEVTRLQGLGRLQEAGAAAAKITAGEAAASKLGTTLDALRGETLGYRNLLPGDAGLKFAQGMDVAGDWLSRTLPVRAIGAAFDAAKGGRLDWWGQRIAETRHGMMPEARLAARTAGVGFADEMRQVGEAFKSHFGKLNMGLNDEEVFQVADEVLPFIEESLGANMRLGSTKTQFTEGLRAVAEAASEKINAVRRNIPGASEVTITPGDIASMGGDFQKVTNLAEKIAATNKGIRDQIERMGGSIGDIDIHAPRFLGDKALNAMQAEAFRSGRSLGVKGASQMGRSEEIAKIHRVVVNRMLEDPNLREMASAAGNYVKADAEHITNKLLNDKSFDYRAFLDDTYKAGDKLQDAMAKGAPQAEIDAIRDAAVKKHAEDLGKWIEKHHTSPMFTNPSLHDEATYLASQYKTQKSIESIHELYRRNLLDPKTAKSAQAKVERRFEHGRWVRKTENVIPDPTSGTAPEVFTTLRQAYIDAGLNPDKAIEHLAERMGKTVDEIKDMAVPAALANSASGFMEAATNTKFQSWIGQALDAMNRVFKIGVTAHPANWVRNWYSGQIQNLVASGDVHGPADIAKYVTFHKQAYNLRDDMETIRDALVHGVIDPSYGSEGVHFGRPTRSSSLDVFTGMPVSGAPAGAAPKHAAWWDVKEAYQAAKQAEKKDPTKLSSAIEMLVGKPEKSMASKTGMSSLDDAAQRIHTLWQTSTNTSAKANNAVEWQNRVSMYLYLHDKGYSKAAAAEKVRALQLDYREGLSGFEKSVMRRLVPFYSWTRLVAPSILTTLKDRPGGVMANMIKASSRVGERDAVTPDYLAQGLSLKYGETPQGDLKYVSATGMPWEDLFSFFGGQNVGRSALLEAGSRLTPYLKAPLEWAFGRSMFQQGPSGGRNIEDLDPNIGRLLRNAEQQIRYLAGDKEALTERPPAVRIGPVTEHVLSNSPFSRYLTSARTVLDPRKAWYEKAVNLLTGARATTVSPAASEGILRERTEMLARELGARQYTHAWFPPEVLERMSPEDKDKAVKMQELWKVLNKHAKERKKQQSAAVPAL